MSKDAIEKLKIGVLYFLLGSACTYAAIYRPLQMARDAAPSVTTSRLMMAVAPILPDVWESAAFTSIFLASSSSSSQALPTPAHLRVTQAVGQPLSKNLKKEQHLA